MPIILSSRRALWTTSLVGLLFRVRAVGPSPCQGDEVEVVQENDVESRLRKLVKVILKRAEAQSRPEWVAE